MSVDAGFFGYEGGLEKLLKDCKIPDGSYKKRAFTKHRVWHVGGPNRYRQYRPQHFVVPVIHHAVQGGATRLVCMVSESSQSGRSIKTDSGLTGDYVDVPHYVKDVFSSTNGMYSKFGFYYRLLNPTHEVKEGRSDSPCKVYLDFDLTECKSVHEAYDHVFNCIKVIRSRLAYEAKLSDPHGVYSDVEFVLAYGCRDVDGKRKYSFHVVFYKHRFLSSAELKAWLEAHVSGLGLEYDDRAYSRHQLMRIPWCGKHGDLSAVLLPTEFTKNSNGQWVPKVTHEFFDVDQFNLFNINAYDFQKDDMITHEHNDVTHVRGAFGPTRVSIPVAQVDLGEKDTYSTDILKFFKPLLPSIRERIQRHRRQISELVGGGGVPLGGNVSPPVLQPCGGVDDRIGIFHYVTDSDNFCEYDAPTHYHSTGQKITIQLNLVKGTYNQLCFACNPVGHRIRYYSLFELDRIAIRLYRVNVSPQFLELSRDGLAAMFVQYFNSDLVFNPALCSSVIVYDDATKLWVYSDRTKANILLKKKNQMKEDYINYLTARYLATLSSRKSVADKKEKARIIKEGKELSKVPAFADVKNFVELVTNNMHSSSTVVEQLDCYPNLVPLKDGQCFDVFTGTLKPMEKCHYHTSVLNAVYKDHHMDEEDSQFIKDWQLQISSNRPDLALYHQRLDGLFFTFLKLDRKFYGNVAPAGNNGKSIKRKMLKAAMTDPTGHGQNRYTNLNNKFFCLSSNSGTAASAPRPDWVKMLHRTCYLVEELPGVKLDTDILKLIASQDEYEARLLYNNIIADIQIRGRLFINTNYAPQLGDTKPVWNRAVLIPWDTIYVDKKSLVNPDTHRYLMDEQFINILKSKLDSYVSVSLRALHRYLKPFVVDGQLKCSDLTRPKCVIDYTESYRAKHMSVEIFVNQYTRLAEDHDDRTPLTKAHTAYRQFLRQQGLPDVDYITFCDKLEIHSYKTVTVDFVDYFATLVLTDDAYQFLHSEAPKGSIERAFFHQASKKRASI